MTVAERDAALARIEHLEAALKPFAIVGAELDHDPGDNNILIAWRSGRPSLTVRQSDFHGAAAALAGGSGSGEQPSSTN